MATKERMNLRNPDSYTLGIPKIYFSPIPYSGNFSRWVDWKALVNGIFGITDTTGQVINYHGNAVGTPDDIRKKYYLGSISNPSLGGDLQTLEHTISNLGYEETDRVIVLQRPIEYSFSFEEPEIENLGKFFVSQPTDLGVTLHLMEDPSYTFQGSYNSTITVINKSIGDPAEALDAVRSVWLNAGKTGEPPNGVYGFIIGGNYEAPLVGDWERKRQWLAYANLDFATETIGTWTYIRPKGTAANDSYGSDPLFSVNDAVLSIVDSRPCVDDCSDLWRADTILSWNGFEWVLADEGFYGFAVTGTRRAFKRVFGCAVMTMATEIGTSMIHVIPRCSLVPDGNFTFDMENWITGGFRLFCQRDVSAKLLDRKPVVSIPFGYLQTFELMPFSG